MSEPPRKRIGLVASKLGYQTRAFDEAAGHVWVELVMATDRCHMLDDPWGDRAVALKFEDPLTAAGIIARVTPPLDGIIAVGDRPAYIAALAAEQLRIPFSPPQAVAACRNKHEARKRFAQAGLPVPEFFHLPVTAGARSGAQRATYPCVLKPEGLSASRGVIRANDPREFVEAFDRIVGILGAPDVVQVAEEQDRYIQVERYIPGREYALEGILTRGRLQVHALFDKPDDLSGPFFEETLYVTPSREPAELQQSIIGTVEKAISALGLTHGPIHAEMRVNAAGIWMLEVAARPIGGICAGALRFSGGASLEELILIHALGEDVSTLRREPAASAVMMIPIPTEGTYRGVFGVEDAVCVPGVTRVEITAKEGQRLAPPPEGSSYLGFIFANGEVPLDAETSVRRAHELLRFLIEPDFPILPPHAGATRSRKAA